MDIYSENIMDHYKEPRNYGILKDANAYFKDSNPLCGDSIDVNLIIENNKIKEIRYECEGCVISKASSSIISEKLNEMDVDEVLKLNKDFVLEYLGINLNPTRLKCGMLSLRAVQKAIAKYKGEI